jgi:rubrerythrin
MPRSNAFHVPIGRATRRQWLHRAALLAAASALLVLPRRGGANDTYPTTAAAMRAAQETEMGVYYRYTEFGRKAQQEGYRGIAYLFAAFAAAEFVHAGNFGRILARINVEVAPIAKPGFAVGSTRDNLLAAANGEVHSVENFYPRLMERITPEGHEDAMAAVRFAWETEKQHRDKIRQIQRWSPSFFEQVAKQIDAKTGSYFVCQVCGNTLNAVPAARCPVCKSASTHFRRIDPPG